jgi:cytochrome c oxidase assembly factor CtaG
MVRSGSIRALAFACGAAAIALAAMLDRLSTVVLSAHMVQHLLLTVIAPLLLVCSRPGIFVRRALPLRWRSNRCLTIDRDGSLSHCSVRHGLRDCSALNHLND